MECFTARNQFRGVKTRFLPGTSLFLPAGDVGGVVVIYQTLYPQNPF